MTGVCPWSHHPQPLPPGKGISQGLVSSWGEAGVLGAALPLQHTTPDPGSTQNLMLQAALKLLDQLQKVTLSADLHPTISHVPPFPQNRLRPAPPLPFTAPSIPAMISQPQSQPPEINTTQKYFSK